MDRLVVDEVIVGGDAEHLMTRVPQGEGRAPHIQGLAPVPHLGVAAAIHGPHAILRHRMSPARQVKRQTGEAGEHQAALSTRLSILDNSAESERSFLSALRFKAWINLISR